MDILGVQLKPVSIQNISPTIDLIIDMPQCRGIRPHLAGQGKSHGFSRVAVGTWGIFSSYSGDVHSKL